MPIYEYVCRQCGNEIEKLQGMSDAPLTQCQACGEAALKRKVSAPSFRLSGDGWYETDFKKDGKRNIAGDQNDGSDTPSDGGGSGSGKNSESKATSDNKSSASGGSTDASSKTADSAGA